MNKAFEINKVKNIIKRQGKEFNFKRFLKNEFSEPTENVEKEIVIKGLYHEQNSYVTISNGDTTRRQKTVVPMILCLYDDFQKDQLQIDDVLNFNNSDFKVNGIVNVQNENITIDISLEVIKSEQTI